MKKILTLLAGALLCGCASNAEKAQDNDNNTTNDNKVLVAYFSVTGNTEKVAKAIAEATDGTLYAITPEQHYTEADLDWRNDKSRSSIEMNDSTSRPALGGEPIDAAQYDVVYLGYPIWWDRYPAVVSTWIESQKLDGKKVYPFATSGSSSITNSENTLRRNYPAIDWQQGKLLNDGVDAAKAWAESTMK